MSEQLDHEIVNARRVLRSGVRHGYWTEDAALGLALLRELARRTHDEQLRAECERGGAWARALPR